MGLVLVLVCASIAFFVVKNISSIIKAICERIRLIYYVGKIPGPLALPIVGTTWQLKWKIEDLTEQLGQWQIYYQSVEKRDLIKFWLGPFPIVALISPKTCKAVLESSEFIRKGPEYDIVQRWLGQGLLTSWGDKWRGRRKMITPAFHFFMLNQYHQVHNEEAQILTTQLKRFAESGEEFDAFPFIKRCALDIICVNAQVETEHPYVNAVKRMNELSFTYTRMPWLWLKPIWYLSGFGAEYDHTLKTVTDFTRDVIAQKRVEFESSPRLTKPANDDDVPSKKRTAFLDLLLRVQSEGQLSDEDIREEVDTFMFEGHDTTSSGMAWTLWCLAHHPDYQQRVVDEVDRVFGDAQRACTTDDLKHLHYLEQCIKESLRLFPPVPFFSRRIHRDLICAGHLIPRHTTVLISPGTLQTSRDLFPDPYTFNPANFAPDRSRDPFSFIPFSAGPRNCIGQKFALMEEKTVLSWIFRCYTVKPACEFKANYPCPEIILKPSRGLPIKLSLRNKS